jgi:hypothetical protein
MSVLQDSQRTEVIDPYYGGGADFEKVFADCRDATEAWFSMWESSPQKNGSDFIAQVNGLMNAYHLNLNAGLRDNWRKLVHICKEYDHR